jgi:hypothetical protein
MANPNAPSGLAPVRYLGGSPWNGAVNIYTILAADTNAFYIGDPVTTIGAANGDGNGLPACTLGAAGAAIRGVIVALGTLGNGGPYINPNNLTAMQRPSGAATVNYYCAVVDDPDVLFEVQEAGAGATLTATSINRNVNLNLGTRTAGLVVSPAFLDNNTVNTTATLNLKNMGLIQRIDNQFGVFQKWLVKINNHEFSAGTASS